MPLHDTIVTAIAARESFDELVAIASPSLRPVCEALRQRIAALHKGFTEVVWLRLNIASYGVGPKKMTEHYAYIMVHASHVNLGFYHGATLPDPSGLLQGSGKKLRHIKLPDVAATRAPAITALLRAAIADRMSGQPEA